MELKETEHNYYCIDTNYYVDGYSNFGRDVCETWKDFKEGWSFGDGEFDHDYNHCFRFDIISDDSEDCDDAIDILSSSSIEYKEFSLKLYFMLQRKGIFRPVLIKRVTESDMVEIEAYLKSCWQYLQNQWSEVIQDKK